MGNYTWRAIQEADLPALAALDAACRRSDGPASVADPDYGALLTAPEVALIGVTSEDAPEQIVAVGWVRMAGDQARLGGKVHPDHRRRRLGRLILRWSETQATTLGAPARLIIRNEALSAGSVGLYMQAGYTCKFVENWLQRDFREPLPPLAHPLPVVPWSADTAGQFFAAYDAAFRERRPPGSPAPDPAEWISEYANDPDFRPDLSLLALAAGQPVGFITAGVMHLPQGDPPIGWISQVGSAPAWRGRAVAAALIVAVLQACQRQGFPAVGLHVNVNNPGASGLYERLGFQFVGQRGLYTKAMNP